ncbi:MAG TPA: carotenoid oxygenase family protein [Anaerolineales bacterium]|nr:carotenoid oxygenase family protein [Anaerolineales bacterium]
MPKPQTPAFVFKNIYPWFRYILLFGRKLHQAFMDLQIVFSKRPASSPVLPDAYSAINTSTIDSEIALQCLEGVIPADIEGSLFICQCLGSPEAYMVGDTNIIRIDFDGKEPRLTNRHLWTPAAIARQKLQNTRHCFDFVGFMYLSPGLGMFAYTEGLYLLPDGRLAVTSDVDRPWVIERDSLQAVTPVGRRDEWLPMLTDNAGEVMGSLFAGYNNSHVLYTDHEKGEVFLVNYRLKPNNKEHPVKLIRWDGYHEFETWIVVDENGSEIEIKQSIHELVFTRDYILLADTAFVAGTEMFTPWKNAKLPHKKTVIYTIDRRDLQSGKKTVRSKQVVVDKPCIHLISEYENPNDTITIYMLHTPATNTAELLRSYDRDLNGNLFPKHLTGYGTLPVLDLSSIGKHIIDVTRAEVQASEYISEMPYCWGPYLYTYMGRQIQPYSGQDLFVMFKGFSRDILPKRIFNAYKDVTTRQVPLEEMVSGEGLHHNNSICRITTKDFKIADAYVFPDRVLLYTISTLDSTHTDHSGYVIAGVVTDQKAGDRSSGHEYWIFSASDLAKGPICKLGHETLNNSTLFHATYIPKEIENKLNQKQVSYHVPIREDYPKEELTKWNASVLECFEEVIWAQFDRIDPADKI